LNASYKFSQCKTNGWIPIVIVCIENANKGKIHILHNRKKQYFVRKKDIDVSNDLFFHVVDTNDSKNPFHFQFDTKEKNNHLQEGKYLQCYFFQIYLIYIKNKN